MSETSNRISKMSRADEIARRIKDAGERAKAEAEARRGHEAAKGSTPKEIGGQSGPEPTRFGDWEKNGIVSDF